MAHVNCIFCRVKRKESREDAIPRWLARTFSAGRKTRLGQAAGPANRLLPGTRHRLRQVGDATFGLLTRGICEHCNNGWMSGLEKRTERILAPIAKGRPLTFLPAGQELVARWVLKTSLVYEHGLFHTYGARRFRGVTQHFGVAERTALFTNAPIPANVFVYLGRNASRVEAVISDPDHLELQSVAGKTPPLRAYKWTFSVHHLTVQLVSFRWPEDFDPGQPISSPLPDAWKRALVTIWPLSGGRGVTWPPREAFDLRALHLLADRRIGDHLAR